jgi:G:T-mismatch repair DNA endonuclease (very short patch repair protein)
LLPFACLMADEEKGGKLSPEDRLRVMRSIRKTDTSPEIAVRRIIHAMGFRYQNPRAR